MSIALQRARMGKLANGAHSRLAAQWGQRRSISVEALDAQKEDRERVVVLGSGWGGYTTARRLDPKKYQVVVVSPRSYFVFTPLLASTSVGTLEFRTALEPVRSKQTDIKFFQGWADSIDFKRKKIVIEEAVDDPSQGMALTADRHENKTGEQRALEKAEEAKKGDLFNLSYDKMIMSVGCYSQTFNTPGVKENAYFLKDVGDARRIRNRILECFETAALPTTSDQMRRNLLNFAVVGGGPTGIEFSAELHDIIQEDLANLYPELMPYYKITVYDVASKVLSMFDENLGKYAMNVFRRDGIDIKTSHHVEELRTGVPSNQEGIKDPRGCYTLKVRQEGEIGVGMVVWSTGLMMNPFVKKALSRVNDLPATRVELKGSDKGVESWMVKKHPRSGAIITNNQLRMILEPESDDETSTRAILKDVYAIGDCAVVEGTMYPATAQVAYQKGKWLAKQLNKGEEAVDQGKGFRWNNMGVMAYLGNWRAIMQSGGGGHISGRAAWFIWRGAYLTRAVSIRNKILIPLYWFVNWAFGRDISRF
ncbi:pyridine nucleotide-disulfide oxidoreductase-domain-containing protein [Phyllosticta citricarpa]